MKKVCSKIRPFCTGVFALLLGVVLSGCATEEDGFQNAGTKLAGRTIKVRKMEAEARARAEAEAALLNSLYVELPEPDFSQLPPEIVPVENFQKKNRTGTRSVP